MIATIITTPAGDHDLNPSGCVPDKITTPDEKVDTANSNAEYDIGKHMIYSIDAVKWLPESGLILGLRPANERRRCFVMPFLIGCSQA